MCVYKRFNTYIHVYALECLCTYLYIYIYIYIYIYVRVFVREYVCGASGVIVIVEGNGHGDLSSNPGRGFFSCNTNIQEKDRNSTILSQAMDKS